MTTIYVPRQELITGADLSGTDGDLNRTYTLAHLPALDIITVIVNVVPYTRDVDFTFNGTIVTFLGSMLDLMTIQIDYFTTYAVPAQQGLGTLKYATPLQVCDYLEWSKEIPEFISGSSPSKELVDSSGTLATGSIIYLDHNKVISESYTLYYGASATSLNELTETTHYVIDVDSGEIIITTAGATLINTDKVYADYKYIEVEGRPSVRDTLINNLITRASAYIDGYCNRTFCAPTVALQEEMEGKGLYACRYRTHHLLPLVVKTTLTTTIDDADTTVVLGSTTGLVAGMYLNIDSEVLQITTVTNGTDLVVTRNELGSTVASHTAGVNVINAVVELSVSPKGATPAFQFMTFRKDWDIDADTGLFTTLYANVVPQDITNFAFPELRVPNRIRITYAFGSSTIPDAVTQACILVVSRWLTTSAIARGLAEGNDGFSPRANDVLTKDIKDLLIDYTLLLADGF